MESSATSKRKLLPFVPDVPYHIQLVFIFTFFYIWSRALSGDYLEDLSKKTEEERAEIHVSSFGFTFLITKNFMIQKAGWWQSIYSCSLFLCTFSYLRP